MFKNKVFLYAKLMRLDKPIGILLLLWPPFWIITLISEGLLLHSISIIFLLGVITTRSIGCVINDFFDKDYDFKVSRTKGRPFAANLISKQEVILIFLVLSALNLSLLYFLNTKTILLAVIAIFLIITYPLTKRFFIAPQVFLGFTFAMSTLMAHTALTNNYPDIATWLFFSATFVWVLMFDTIYALADIKDDLKVGIKSTAILFGKKVFKVIAFLQFIFYLIFVYIGVYLGFAYIYYFFLILAVAVGVYNQILINERKPEMFIKAFINNQYVGFLIFLGIYGEYFYEYYA